MLKDVLRQLRIRSGKTQQYLAAFLQVQRPTYTRYESGSSRPDLDTLCRLADFYGVSVDYLLGRQVAQEDPALLYFLELYKNTNEQGRQSALYCLEMGQPHRLHTQKDKF